MKFTVIHTNRNGAEERVTFSSFAEAKKHYDSYGGKYKLAQAFRQKVQLVNDCTGAVMFEADFLPKVKRSKPMRGFDEVKGFAVKDKAGKVLFTTNNYAVACRAASLHKGAYVSYWVKH